MKLKEFEDLAKKYNCLVLSDGDFDGLYYYLYAPKLADYRLATYYPKFQAAEMYTIIDKKQFTKIEDLEYELRIKFKLLKQKRIEKKLNDLEKDFENVTRNT
jgi:hypothetical protein